MTAVKLLWFFVWRMTLLGLALGAGLGAAYGGALLLAALPFGYEVDVGTSLENFANALASAPAMVALGVVFGALFGAPVGLVLGVLNGLLLGSLTSVLYRPPTDAARCRRAAGAVCGTTTLLLFLACWANAGFDPTTYVVPVFHPSFFARAWLDLAFITLAPMVVAALAMGWAGRKAAIWYALSNWSASE